MARSAPTPQRRSLPPLSDILTSPPTPLGPPAHEPRMAERHPTPEEAALYERLSHDPLPSTAAYFGRQHARVLAGWVNRY